MANLTLRNKLQWNVIRNSYIFIEQKAYENVICEMAAIFSRSQCVKIHPHGRQGPVYSTWCGDMAAGDSPTKHYSDVIIDATASQINSLTIVYSTVYSSADQRKHQSSASLAFVWGIHRWPVNSPHKWPITRKIFLFDDVIMKNQGASGFKIEIVLLKYFVRGTSR